MQLQLLYIDKHSMGYPTCSTPTDSRCTAAQVRNKPLTEGV